ncbi:MAG TPA: biopolymer transporter ExbD [Longimicrobiales bacterium]
MGMSTGSGRSGVMADINVTPMVDVMLVLLIIFMVATPALLAGFNAKLPEGEFLKPRPEVDDRVELGIDANGAYYLNKKPIRREDALELLKAEFAARPEDKVLFVRAHRSLKYEEVVAAMTLARDAGARVVAAITEQKPGTTSPEDDGARP